MTRRCNGKAKTVTLDPVEMLAIICPKWSFPHITVNENIRRDDGFFRYERTAHDSTFLFSYQAMGKLLHPLLKMESFKTSSPPDLGKKLFAIAYEVSMIRNCIVYGMIEAQCGRISGFKEGFRIYAKPRYIYNEAEGRAMHPVFNGVAE